MSPGDVSRRCPHQLLSYLLVVVTVLTAAPIFMNRILLVIVFVLLFLSQRLHLPARRIAGDVSSLQSLFLIKLVQPGQKSGDDGFVLIQVRVPATEQVSEKVDELVGLDGGV